MKICILGWYGTETIGDRAIFAGIVSLLNKSIGEFQVSIGSLYPFYSRRMLSEDKELYRILLNRDLEIDMFDSKNKSEIEVAIYQADIVIIGGGPLMDLAELYMLKFAFEYAKNKNKKTMIFGCGIGPLFDKKYQECVLDIVNLSDSIILRDSKSKNNLIDLSTKLDINLSKEIDVGFDPAIECASLYRELMANKQEDLESEEVVLNFREFPNEYSANKDIKQCVERNLKMFLYSIASCFKEKRVLLIPMHYFSVGNDDRYFLNKILMESQGELANVSVQNFPLSLTQTMNKFFHAEIAVGMRFHSVVLQTILNGNNIILDYTEPQKGKISGFINDIDRLGFYNKRYINLQMLNKELNMDNFELNMNKFEVRSDYFKVNQEQYFKAIEKIL